MQARRIVARWPPSSVRWVSPSPTEITVAAAAGLAKNSPETHSASARLRLGSFRPITLRVLLDRRILGGAAELLGAPIAFLDLLQIEAAWLGSRLWPQPASTRETPTRPAAETRRMAWLRLRLRTHDGERSPAGNGAIREEGPRHPQTLGA